MEEQQKSFKSRLQSQEERIRTLELQLKNKKA